MIVLNEDDSMDIMLYIYIYICKYTHTDGLVIMTLNNI